MGKYIIIEEDPKVRREILVYLRELDADAQVLEFTNSKDFEQRFLLPLVRPKQESKLDPNVLQGFKAEVLEFLKKAQFASEPPFPGDILSLEVNKDDLSVIKCNFSKGKVFGEALPDVFKNGGSVEKFIAPDFKETFDAFKRRVASGQPTKQILAFEAANREVWVVEAENIVIKGVTTVHFRNRRNELLKLLGKEDQILNEEEKEPEGIDVFIFRYNAILEKDIAAWVTKIAALTKKLSLWPAGSRPKFIVTRYEDDKGARTDFYHPFVDDMICLPFDRLIVLQKLEIIKALPEKAEPSYLFVQECQELIEVGKKVTIERMSDVGFAVANPVPLATGTPGHFYFKFPGQKQMLDCHGKVTHSLPHPERENEHLVFFSFFGLDRNVLKEVRAYLSRDTGYKMLLSSSPAEFEFNPDNIFLSDEQKRYKTVAVIDTDDKNLETAITILKKDIGGLNVVSDNSYYNFFRNYLSANSAQDRTPFAAKEDFYYDNIAFLIGVDDTNLQMCLTPPDGDAKLLGHEAQKLFSTPQGWLDLFQNEHARNLLNECLYIVKSTKRLQRNFDLTTADGQLRAVTLEIILEENGKIARINMTPPDPRLAPSKRIEPLESLDAILIEATAISGDLNTFISGLREAVSKANIKTFPDGPRVILMAERITPALFEKALKSSAAGLLLKPLEVKRLCYLAHTALDNPFTMYNFENIGWKTDTIQGKIAREADLVQLAEFGATLKMNQKLKTGSMIYLFRSIYRNAPDSNLCCRVYHAEENPAEEGTFLNYVTYYGITDAFLKFTRAYIRETYAEKKAQESGGAEE